MRKSRGRRAAAIIGAVGLAIIGVAAFIERDRIAEAWYRWRLTSHDDAVRWYAAARLGERHCASALTEMAQAIIDDRREETRWERLADGKSCLELTPFAHAIHAIDLANIFSALKVKVWYLLPSRDTARLEAVLTEIGESWQSGAVVRLKTLEAAPAPPGPPGRTTGSGGR